MHVITSLVVRGCFSSLQTSASLIIRFFCLLHSAPSCAPPPVDNAGPPVEADAHTFTYRCYEGYVLLQGNDTLRCNNGQLEGEPPVCTSEFTLPPRHTYLMSTLTSDGADNDLSCVFLSQG